MVSATLSAWVMSLILPGFNVAGQADSIWGYQILLFGMVFGPGVGGWAVYANVFFLFAAFKLKVGKTPIASIWLMLLLTATLPFFRGAMLNEGGAGISPVVSWGWGFVLWLFAILSLASVAAYQARVVSRTGMRVLAYAAVTISLGIGCLSIVQRLYANEQERDVYLPVGMAFTQVEFCGIPVSMPLEPVIPPGELIRLDIEPKLLAHGGELPRLELPKLLRYEEDGFDWVSYREVNSSYVVLTVREPAKPKRFVLQGRQTDEGAAIRLIDAKTNSTLYEQRLKIRPLKGGGSMYCPASGTSKGYMNAITRAVGQHLAERYPKETLKNETGRIACSLGSDYIDGTKDDEGLLSWDGRVVNLSKSLRSRVGFCSESYIGLLYVSENATAGPLRLSPVVILYDRKSLRPLAAFNDGIACPLREKCPESSKDILLGFRIEGDTANVITTHGELAAKHRQDK